MNKYRINKPIGTFIFQISELNTGSWISCESKTLFGNSVKQRYFDVSLEQINDSFKEYIKGTYAQDCFSYLSPDDREWIISGGM